jgi:hypothetical protein
MFIFEASPSTGLWLVSKNNSVVCLYFLLQDRMWRKTRSQTGNRCYGADANRNFDFHWLGK